MRWDVVGLVLGWTIRLIAIPTLLVFFYSAFVENEGLEYAATTYLPSFFIALIICLLYTSPSPRDGLLSRMPSSA